MSIARDPIFNANDKARISALRIAFLVFNESMRFDCDAALRELDTIAAIFESIFVATTPGPEAGRTWLEDQLIQSAHTLGPA